MEESPTVITITPMKSKYKWNTSMISDGRNFGCFPTTIKRRGTDTLMTKDILNKRSVDDANRRSRTDLGVNTEKILIGMLEEISF